MMNIMISIIRPSSIPLPTDVSELRKRLVLARAEERLDVNLCLSLVVGAQGSEKKQVQVESNSILL